MRSYALATLFTLALAGSQVMAAPMEPHMIAKREDVCKVNMRGVSNNDCLKDNKGTNYSLNKPSSIASAQVTSVPNGSTCDQIIEIQLLNDALNNHKICNLLSQMKLVKKELNKNDVLKPLADIMTSQQNLAFVNNDVENRKKEVVKKGVKGDGQNWDDTGKAVGNFLSQTKGTSQDVAKKLDEKIADIVKQAQEIHDKIDDKKAVGKLQKSNMQKALDLAKKTTTPVADDWNKVLNSAPHS